MSDILVESFDVDKANGGTHTLANDVGSLASAFVKNINNTRKGSAGLVGSTANLGPRDASMAAELTATDTLTFRNANGTQKMMGEVWRYTGAPGGANEFIVRGRVAITLTTAQLSNLSAISGIVSEANCVPFVAGYSSTETSNSDYEGSTFGVRMDGSGNVVVSRQSNTGSSITVYITVVEFTGANWTVASAVSSNHDTARELVTLSEDIGDWGTAFIEATGEGDTSETGLADTMFLVQVGTTTSNVYVDYQDGDPAARNDGTAYVYVVQNDDMIVTRSYNASIREGNNSYGTNLGFPAGTNLTRDINQLGLEWTVSTNGTGIAHARASLAGRIANASSGTINHWVHRSGNNVHVRWGVIDLSQLTAPAGSPSDSPSDSPSASISNSPSNSPSDSISNSPSDSVSDSPSDSPSTSPSESPSDSPSSSISSSASSSVSSSPSVAPHPGGILKRWTGSAWEETTGFMS